MISLYEEKKKKKDKKTSVTCKNDLLPFNYAFYKYASVSHKIKILSNRHMCSAL